VTGDFNGDGKLDWVVANAGDNTLCIYLGNGDGTSQPPVIIPLSGQSPVSIAAADINRDGKLDLAVLEADSYTVGILLGDGDGTFQPETEIQVNNAEPFGIALADVNRDGFPDLLIAISGPNNADFEVLLNDSKGNFGSPIYGPALISDGLDEGFSFSVGDMNGDGIPDLLVCGVDAFSTTLKSYFGNGDGTFTAGSLIWTGNPGVGSDVTAVALADVNGDGCLDATVAMDLGWVNIFYNDCHGDFPTSPNFEYGVGDSAYALAVADVNGDGFPDIITGGLPIDLGTDGIGYAPGDTITVRLNNGTGQFKPAQVYRGDAGVVAIVPADLQFKGFPAILTANQNSNSVTVYANDGAGIFGDTVGGYDGFLEGAPTSPANAPMTNSVAVDIDGDGKPDIALIERASFSYNDMLTAGVMLNQGNGSFGRIIRTPLAGTNGNDYVWDYILADFRNTGKPDLIVLAIDQVDATPGALVLYAQNAGSGQFQAAVSLPCFNDPYAFGSICVGDFNKDGKLDLAVVVPGTLTVYLGNGDGTFGTPFMLDYSNNIATEVYGTFVEDINGGGNPDILTWFQTNDQGDPGLTEFLGNGDGTFQQPIFLPLPAADQMTMADLNHDGLLDIVDVESETSSGFVGATSPTVYVYLGQSGGGFSAPVIYPQYAGRFDVENSPTLAPYLGDFNGDGNLDLAIYQFSSSLVTPVYLQFLSGNGDGTFTPTYDVAQLGIIEAPELAAPNLLGDGRASLVQTPTLTSSFQVLPDTPASALQIEMSAIPVIANSDAVVISLDVPSSSDTTVALSTSDPNVMIPASATVPAGQLSVEVPFTLTNSFPANHWFSVSATTDGVTEAAYNFPLAADSVSPFAVSISGGYAAHTSGNFSTPAPGETSLWSASIASTGVGSGTFQVSCFGLPAGASCEGFSPSALVVDPGMLVSNTFSIATDPSMAPGAYSFFVAVSDGFVTGTVPAVLRVGDFSLSLSPAISGGPATGTAAFSLTTTFLYGYAEGVTLSCSNLPSGAVCDSQGEVIEAGSTPQNFTVDLVSVPAGLQTFTLTGTSSPIMHSINGQMNIAAQALVAITQTSLSFGTVLVGVAGSAPGIALTNTGNAPLSLTSIVAAASSGANGSFGQTNNCPASLGSGLSCTINLTFTPSAVGVSTGTLTFSSDAINPSPVVQLAGTGIDFSLQAAPSGSTTATIKTSQTALYDLEIQTDEMMGTSASISLACSGQPTGSNCTVSPNTGVISSGGPMLFQVQVLPKSNTEVQGLRIRLLREGPRVLCSVLAFALSLAFFSFLAWTRWRRPLRYRLALLMVGAILAVAGCAGSNSGGSQSGSQSASSSTYTITVTAQADGGTRTLNLTLIEQ